MTFLRVNERACLAVVLAACAGRSEPLTSVRPPSSPPPAATEVASVPTTPVVARSSAPDVFHPWFRSDDELYVLPGEGALVYGPNTTATVVGDVVKVAQRTAFGMYLPTQWAPTPMGDLIDGVFGAWPHAAFVGKRLGAGDCRCGCPGFLDRWVTDHWEPASLRPSDKTSVRQGYMGASSLLGRPFNRLNVGSLGSSRFVTAAAFDPHRVAIVAEPTCAGGSAQDGGNSDTNKVRILTMRDGVLDPDRPLFTPLKPGDARSATRMASVGRIAVDPSGGMLVVGGDVADRAAVELWKSATAPSAYAELPKYPGGQGLNYHSWDGLAPSAAIRSMTDIWVGGSRQGRAYLAHYDGATWTPIDSTIGAAIGSMSGLAGDHLYLTTVAGDLWINEGGLAWTPVKLPENARVFQVRTSVDEGRRDVWLAGGRVVLRSKPAARVVSLFQGPRADMQQRPRRGEQPVMAPTDGCAAFFVPLFEVSESMTDSYEFPQTQAAVRGHPELAPFRFGVTDDGRFGALAPDYGSAKTLVAFARANIKQSVPRIVCEVVSMRRVTFQL